MATSTTSTAFSRLPPLADGVVHLAFKHEAMRTGDFMGAIAADLAAIQAIGEALVGTDKPFVTTGGTLMLAMAGITGRPGSEDDQSGGGPRVEAANYTLSLAQRGVRSSVVRLAPMVHSDLDRHGFTSALIGFARENGAAAYIAAGANRWPAANSYDIGVLYRLAVEKAPAGSTFHGVGDLGIPFKVIAETIAGKLGIETKSVTEKEAPQYLGFLATFAGLDNPVSNDKTRDVLGWEPPTPVGSRMSRRANTSAEGRPGPRSLTRTVGGLGVRNTGNPPVTMQPSGSRLSGTGARRRHRRGCGRVFQPSPRSAPGAALLPGGYAHCRSSC